MEERIRCDVRLCAGVAVSRVFVEHPMHETFRLDLCSLHLAITSTMAILAISPLGSPKRNDDDG